LAKTVRAVVVKLSEQMGNGSGILLINSPGGSTLQCGMGRDICICINVFGRKKMPPVAAGSYPVGLKVENQR